MASEESLVIKPNEARITITLRERLAGTPPELTIKEEGFAAPTPSLLRLALIQILFQALNYYIGQEQALQMEVLQSMAMQSSPLTGRPQ